MTKPRLIILVRHAQSEGNKNREIHQNVPDHRVKLTPEGIAQAHDAGRRLRGMLRPDDTLRFFTSPYRRTRETTEGILATLTGDDPGPSPFRRSNIKVYEEPRLREQDFGNFQPCGAEMERMWQERADYGHFFYRIPNGESAADAYDRVSGFNESLWRQFGEDDFASVCVLVTHGLLTRVFLSKWYHFTVEYFEDLRNINHCEFLIMRKQDNGKYLLENNLRTWSELRRERAQSAKDKDKDGKDPPPRLDRSKTVTATRRWGGCPNGCNHSSHYKKRQDLDLLRQRDGEHAGGDVAQGPPSAAAAASAAASASTAAAAPPNPGTNTNAAPTPATTAPSIAVRRQQPQPAMPSSDDDYFTHSDALPTPDIDVTRTLDDVDPPPTAPLDAAPPPIPSPLSPSTPHNHHLRRPAPAPIQHLHVGRDGGGSSSGHASLAGSDTEPSDDDDNNDAAARRRGPAHLRVASLNARLRAAVDDDPAPGRTDDEADLPDQHRQNQHRHHHHHHHHHGRRRGAPGGGGGVNRLGDDPGPGSEGDVEPEDLERAEREDRSIRGSVY